MKMNPQKAWNVGFDLEFKGIPPTRRTGRRATSGYPQAYQSGLATGRHARAQRESK